VVAVADGHRSGAKKGTLMELLIVAIVAVVGVGAYRLVRARTTS
jgi:hypothetical protein